MDVLGLVGGVRAFVECALPKKASLIRYLYDAAAHHAVQDVRRTAFRSYGLNEE
jgi:hypothetical protein